MRTAALLAGLAFAALASTTAHAASPYPPSNIRMSWNTATYRWSGSGGDIWPVTLSSTGPLVTAWGDGVIGCGTKASYGWAQIVSNQPSTTSQTRSISTPIAPAANRRAPGKGASLSA